MKNWKVFTIFNKKNVEIKVIHLNHLVERTDEFL